ncbi:hypothetical protein L7F22_009105 [Adiantum nelumboides]|nr:hypothetical protein [Adiantum nelumboides]
MKMDPNASVTYTLGRRPWHIEDPLLWRGPISAMEVIHLLEVLDVITKLSAVLAGPVYEANRSFECVVRSLSDNRAFLFPFLKAFSEAEGDAGQFALHTLSFKRSMRDIATLYGCSSSFKTIEEYGLTQTMEALCSKCLEATKLSAVLIDDGLRVEKMYLLEWLTGCAEEYRCGSMRRSCGTE